MENIKGMYMIALMDNPPPHKSELLNKKSRFVKIADLLKLSGGVAGTQSHVVKSDKDPSMNALNFIASYMAAKNTSLEPNSRYTLLLTPGVYNFNEEFVFDGDNVDVVSIVPDVHGSVIFRGQGVRVSASNCHIHGISTESQRFKVDSGLTGFSASYCVGGDFSFGGYQNGETLNDSEFYGSFYHCRATDYSFGSRSVFNHADFYNCHGNDYCFGSGAASLGHHENCSAAKGSFGGFDPNGSGAGICSGKYVNCSAHNDSFGGGVGGSSQGTYWLCSAGPNSFGSDPGSFSGWAHYCSAASGSFNAPGGKILFCSLDGTPI